MAHRFPRKNNSWYPLPPDYPRLSANGQRLARRNAILLGEKTPADLVTAWSCFREWYLRPEDTHWYKRWKPSPPKHYQMVEDAGRYSRNAVAFPRSFAKSTVANELALMLLIARENFAITLLRAIDKKSRKNMARMKSQLENNAYLIDDWGPFKGKRGDRIWNTEMLELPNGSSLEGASVRGAVRGDRPDLLLIDDPEYDEDEEVEGRSAQLLEDFETLLFKTLLGMLDDGCPCFWIGTLITRKSFLYHICKGDDPRFGFWNRRVASVCELEGDQIKPGSLIWKEKWDEQAVRDRMTGLGAVAFNSEMMNNPGTGSERIISIHPELCTYTVEGAPEKEPSPLTSAAEIRYKTPYKEGDQVRYLEDRKPFSEFASHLFRVATVDYASTQKATSDFSCIQVMGFDRSDTLWVLDTFLGRVRDEALIRQIWEMSSKWRVKLIGVEAVAIQKHLADRVRAFVGQASEGTAYVPRVVDVRYPGRLSKAERIAGLEWRFRQHKFRLPAHRKHEFPVRETFYQLENFTMDLSLLRFDDAADTIAMHQYVVRRSGVRKQQAPKIRNFLEHIRDGVLRDEDTGVPFITGVDASDLDHDALNALRAAHYARVGHQPTGEPEIPVWTSGPFGRQPQG